MMANDGLAHSQEQETCGGVRSSHAQPTREQSPALTGVHCSHGLCTGRPLLRAWMGLVPAATIFMPSAMMAALRMVAVVVPSPAVSFVFDAACTATNRVNLRGEMAPACRASAPVSKRMTGGAFGLPREGARTNTPRARALLVHVCCALLIYGSAPPLAQPQSDAAHACLVVWVQLSGGWSGSTVCPTGDGLSREAVHDSRDTALQRQIRVQTPPADPVNWPCQAGRTCRTSLAPMFSTGSSSSTSFATVTPSFTIRGDPYLLSSTTLRPCTCGHCCPCPPDACPQGMGAVPHVVHPASWMPAHRAWEWYHTLYTQPTPRVDEACLERQDAQDAPCTQQTVPRKLLQDLLRELMTVSMHQKDHMQKGADLRLMLPTLGPRVTPTTLLSLSTPACSFLSASMFLLKCSCFAMACVTTAPPRLPSQHRDRASG